MGTALFLAHEDDRARGVTEAGSLADAARARGFQVTVAHPSDGLPDPAAAEMIVVLGSLHSAHGEGPAWVDTEHAYLDAAVAAGTPVLGVCFGGQLMSRVLGGRVERSPSPEVGFVSVESTWDALDAGPWMQWHFDHFHLPPGARLLAHNDAGIQAFGHGRVVGTQFHPEITAASFAAWRLGWTDATEADVRRDFGVDVDDLAQRIADDADDLARRCARLLDGFLELVGDADIHGRPAPA